MVLNKSVNCEVGLALIISILKSITKIGTKITPPPTPKKLDIIPALKFPITIIKYKNILGIVTIVLLIILFLINTDFWKSK